MGDVLTSLPFWLGLAAIIFVLGSVGGGLRVALKAAYWFRLLLGRRNFGRARPARWRDLRSIGMDREGGLLLGSLRGRGIYHNGEGHLMTIAGTGGGKSSGLVVPALCGLTEGAVVVTDPSGELAAMTARRRAEIGPVVFLNPFGSVFGAETGLSYPDTGFNPMSTLNPQDPNFFAETKALARFLMVTDRQGSGSYWNDEGAALLALLMASVVLYHPSESQNFKFLYDLTRESAEGMEDYLWHITQKGHPALRSEAERFRSILQTAPAQWAGFLSKAALALDRYAPTTPLGEHTAKNGFDISRIKREKITVYLMVPSSMLPTALPWLNMLLGVFSAAVGKPGPRSPVTLLMDEAPSLGYLPDLRATMAQNRKAGLRVWLFTQTYASFAAPEMYGAEGMKALLGLCLIKQFFAVDEPEVCELVSKMAGQKSVSNASTSGNMGDVGQPLIRPEEVRGMRKWHQILFRGELSYPIKARLVPYFENKKLRVMVDPNPYRENR